MVFLNANKLVQLNNRQDKQRQIKTFYIKNNKDIILLAYYKMDLAILQFINITRYY